MTFLAPAFLWLLLAIPAVTALYLLKVRSRRRSTPVLFLWEQIFKEKQSSILLRRLRDLFSLILVILAMLAVILALAKPVWSPAGRNRDLLLIIDRSAEMSAGASGDSRLNQAKTAASNIIRNLDGNRKAALTVLDRELQTAVSATDDPRSLLDGLEKIKPSALPLNPHALKSLENSKGFIAGSRVILLSGGNFPEVGKLPGDIELFKVGKPLENAGIVAFDLTPLPGKSNTLKLFFRLASSFKKDVETDVMLCKDDPGNIVKVCPVKLKPGLNKAETYTVEYNADPEGKWLLVLSRSDALATDNTAYAVVARPEPVRVGIASGSNNGFFRKCVEAFRKTAPGMTLDQENPDVVVASGDAAEKYPGKCRKFVIFNPGGKTKFWKSVSPEKSALITKVLHPDHPAIKYCGIASLTFPGQKKIVPPEQTVVLAENEHGNPLIYKASAGKDQAFVVNLDPAKSDFFLEVAFPVMVYSMALDLTGRTTEKSRNFATGDIFKVSGNTKNIVTPSKIILPPAKQVCLDETGFYQLEKPDGKPELIAVSLRSPADALLDNSQVKSTAGPVEAGISLSSILLGIAIALLALECVLYHRRKVG